MDSTIRRALLHALAGVALAMSSVGCTEDELPSYGRVRVVAVRANPPTGTPGQAVELALLNSHDIHGWGWTPESPPTQVAWLGGCHNPPGGEYYGCYPALREAVSNYSAPLDATPDSVLAAYPGLVGLGDRFTFTVPSDIIGASHQTGMSYVFFAACAGRLTPAPDITDAVPLACLGEHGERLGRDAYDMGFATVPTVAGVSNANPVMTGLELNGVPVPYSHLDGVESTLPQCENDADCAALGDGRIEQACASADRAGHCIPVLQRCTSAHCSHYVLAPTIDLGSAEPNLLAAASDGSVPLEVLRLEVRGPWLWSEREFTRRGDGWSESFDVPVDPPSEIEDGDEAAIWLVLRDNRGGVTWLGWDFKVGG